MDVNDSFEQLMQAESYFARSISPRPCRPCVRFQQHAQRLYRPPTKRPTRSSRKSLLNLDEAITKE